MLPLEGTTVIDLTQAEFGPRAALLLADMGAEVIKIEPREGEYTRPVTRDYDTAGLNCYFLAHNRNKRGIALDFTKPDGKAIIYKLVERSDVFMTTYAPGSTERHGFSYEDLCKYNPKIIYCRGSGYGGKGPFNNRKGYDIALQGWSGLMYQNSVPDSPPVPIGTAVIDQAGGLALAFGIMAALLVRERTGEGQIVEGSLLQTSLYLLSMEYVSYMVSGKHPPKGGRGHAMVKGLYHIFPTQDRWIVIAGVRNEPWPEFCQALGTEHLQDDPRFVTTDDRENNRSELIPILDEIFRTRPSNEWVKRLHAAGVIASPVYSLGEALADPELSEQIRANDYLVEVDTPQLGKARVVGPVVHLSKTPGKVKRPGFNVGEHTHEVLLELGYTWEDIARLVTDEVI